MEMEVTHPLPAKVPEIPETKNKSPICIPGTLEENYVHEIIRQILRFWTFSAVLTPSDCCLSFVLDATFFC